MRNNLKFLLTAFVFLSLSYSNQNLQSKTLFPGDDAYLAFAETMPEPVGGLEQIFKKISYPEAAKKNGINGKVYAMAMINEKGEVDDAKVIKGIGGGCDEEVVKALKSSKFKPAQNQGSPVKAKFTMAFTFKITG
jgi:protein TonB